MTTDIKELMQELKAAAIRAKIATEEYASGRMSVSVCCRECEEFNRLTDGPDQILPLIEALEASESRLHDVAVACATAEQALESKDARIVESEQRVKTQNRHVCELFDKNTALRLQVAELQSRAEAAEKLVSEQKELIISSRIFVEQWAGIGDVAAAEFLLIVDGIQIHGGE